MRTYLQLYKSGELKKRALLLMERLESCDICPRKCEANRFKGKHGFCRSGNLTSVSSFCDHHGEEPVLSGTRGSGTIFFSNCNMKCIFCQNYQISQGENTSAREISTSDLAHIMLYLQNNLGCHNINLVSPTHYVPQIIYALTEAIPEGLHVPLVYNTNAYDSLETLKMLDGIIDIYLPDIKYASNVWAEKFSKASNYVDISRAAIVEMCRQTGNLVIDENGLAEKGLIVRHLILPNEIAGSKDSLKWLAENVSKNVAISLMAQYYPAHRAYNEPLLARKISQKEYNEVVSLMDNLGLENGWIQTLDAAEFYRPDFDILDHPFEKRRSEL